MKFSTKVRYGMRAVVELAQNFEESPVMVSKLAEKQNLSVKYLESLMSKLKKGGVVKSVRGNRGGYLLTKDPQEISVYEIVTALEGPISLVNCSENPENCENFENCCTFNLWKELSQTLTDKMKAIKLSSLVEEARQKKKDVPEISYWKQIIRG